MGVQWLLLLCLLLAQVELPRLGGGGGEDDDDAGGGEDAMEVDEEPSQPSSSGRKARAGGSGRLLAACWHANLVVQLSPGTRWTVGSHSLHACVQGVWATRALLLCVEIVSDA